MKNWLHICVALCLTTQIGQASTEGVEAIRSPSVQRMHEFADLEMQRPIDLYNQKCKQESRVEFSINLGLLNAHGVINSQDLKPILCIGALCFIGSFSILHYLGFL